MNRQTKCHTCEKMIVFFYADEFLNMAPFEIVERGYGDFAEVTPRRVSRDTPPEDRSLILHDCERRG